MSSSFSTADGTRPEAFGPSEWLLVLVPAMIWGTSFLLIDVALDDFAPGLIAFGRIAAGAAALALMPGSRNPVARGDWLRIWMLGFFWMALPFTLFPVAQQWIDSSLAGMLNGTTPLFTAIVATILLRRLPGRLQMLGLAIGFVGVVAILWPTLDGDSSTLGAALVLLAAVSYGLSLNLAVPLQQRYGSVPVFFRTQWCAMVLTAPLALGGIPRSTFSWASLAAVLVLGVGATAIAFVAIGALSGRAGATRASVTVYLVPVVAIAVGVTLNNETVAVVSLVGIAIVLVGAALTSRAERQGKKTPVAASE